MMKFKVQYLCSALDRFKEMILNGIYSKQDISFFADMFKYELDRHNIEADKKQWITKEEASEILGISTSTFDRIVLKGYLPRGKKVVKQKTLLWNLEQIEQYKKTMLLKAND